MSGRPSAASVFSAQASADSAGAKILGASAATASWLLSPRSAGAAATTGKAGGSAGAAAAVVASAPMVEVRYFRSRTLRLVVGNSTTADQLIERLMKEVYLEDFPGAAYALYAPGEPGRWLLGSDVVREPAIWCCGRPTRVLFTEAVAANAAAAGSTAWEPVQQDVLLDLSGVPRDALSEIRHRVLGSKKSDPHLFRFGADYLNLSLTWARQCVIEGAEVALVPVTSLLRKTLQQIRNAEPSRREGWVRRHKSSKMIAREIAYYAVLSHRCLLYFRGDTVDAPVEGVVPLDYYGMAADVKEGERPSFQLAALPQHLGKDPKAEYRFSVDDAGWIQDIRQIKNVPLVFGVPWHWNPSHAVDFLRSCVAALDTAQAHLLPSCFVSPQGSHAELVWFEELLDNGTMEQEVMSGCTNPRTLLALFKRYFCLLPNPLLTRGLSSAVAALTRAGLSDDALAHGVASSLRAIGTDAEMQKELAVFLDILMCLLLYLHKVASHCDVNGATTLVLGRMFGPHLVHPHTGTPIIWQHLSAALIRVAPAIQAILLEPPLQLDPVNSSTGATTSPLQQPVLAPHPPPAANEYYFHFGDISGIDDTAELTQAELPSYAAVATPPPVSAVLPQQLRLIESDDEELRFGRPAPWRRAGLGASTATMQTTTTTTTSTTTTTPPPAMPSSMSVTTASLAQLVPPSTKHASEPTPGKYSLEPPNRPVPEPPNKPVPEPQSDSDDSRGSGDEKPAASNGSHSGRASGRPSPPLPARSARAHPNRPPDVPLLDVRRASPRAGGLPVAGLKSSPRNGGDDGGDSAPQPSPRLGQPVVAPSAPSTPEAATAPPAKPPKLLPPPLLQRDSTNKALQERVEKLEALLRQEMVARLALESKVTAQEARLVALERQLMPSAALVSPRPSGGGASGGGIALASTTGRSNTLGRRAGKSAAAEVKLSTPDANSDGEVSAPDIFGRSTQGSGASGLSKLSLSPRSTAKK